ncbi:unnamed protein product [Cuscuta europaea]|uniref:DUF4283 domain-containing protein n=1 Tax=Cuscuta europaea TaxID=41803 RepID=A0A9P1DXF0_CUSEU|nr:unnamed protein product [Cuscuta europaea]
MARKHQGAGEATEPRITQSRFAVLEGAEDEFPSLQPGNYMKNKDSPVATTTKRTDNFRQKTVLAQEAVVFNGGSPPGQEAGIEVLSASGAIINFSGSAAAIGQKATTLAAGMTHEADLLFSSAVPDNNGNQKGVLPAYGQSTQQGALLKDSELSGNKVKHAEGVISAVTQSTQHQPGGVKPWSNLFKDNRNPTHGIKLRYIPPKGNELDFTDKVLPSMVDMWGYCLVGYFTGRFPGLKAIYDLRSKWNVNCLIKDHEKGWVIFKFQNELDRTKVLNEGPYTVFGKQLILKVLSEDFSFEDEEFLKVPIWVKFPKLPWKLWNDEAMSEVASMVGIPLTTDKVTQERTNHTFARVLIEVDISKPPQLSFPIRLSSKQVFKQMVVYETFPSYCFHCKTYGHNPFICKKLTPTKDGKAAQNVTIVTGKPDSAQHVKSIEDHTDILDTTVIPTVTVREERALLEADRIVPEMDHSLQFPDKMS